MKYLPLVLAGLTRKKIRTLLTVGSFGVALFLFGLLVAIRGAFNQGVEVAGADRLVTINKVSLIQPLPISHRERIQQIEGVELVTFASWFGGIYQDERNFFPQFAIDTETYREMFSEFVIPDSQWEEFVADRQGCVVGAATAERYGLELGDRVPLKGTIFPGTWEFNLRAIYRGSRPQDDTSQFWFHYDYLDEGAPEWFDGTVGWYTVRIDDPDRAVQVSEAIDERFANSPWETRTETEQSFAASFVKQMGNIEFLILLIGSVVFFTLLLVTGNTMAIAVRERTKELAVLKSVGYSDALVLVLVLAESLLVAAIGGGLGIGSVKAFTVWGGPVLAKVASLLGNFYLPWPAVGAGFGLALTVGLVAGLLPALAAMRLSVVDALRRV